MQFPECFSRLRALWRPRHHHSYRNHHHRVIIILQNFVNVAVMVNNIVIVLITSCNFLNVCRVCEPWRPLAQLYGMRLSAGFIKFNRNGKKNCQQNRLKRNFEKGKQSSTPDIGLYYRYFIDRKKKKLMKIPRPVGIVMKMIDIYERNYFPWIYRHHNIPMIAQCQWDLIVGQNFIIFPAR